MFLPFFLFWIDNYTFLKSITNVQESVERECVEILRVLRKLVNTCVTVFVIIITVLFTGGVGENQMECRREVCKDMEFMGIELDNDVNAKVRGEEAIISTPASKVKVVVIPTDEELLIASDTMDILKK